MRYLLMFVAALLIAACGGSSDQDTFGKEIADEYNEAMDRAREVEQELQEHAEDIHKQVEEAMADVEEAVERQRDP